MLLQADKNLEDFLVRILARQGSATARGLFDSLKEDGHAYSIQGIYKELGKLEKQGVMVKDRMSYGLRTPWVLELSQLAEDAGKAAVRIPKHNERLIWHFNDLLKLNNFWSQILLALIQQSEDRNLLTWMPHPWFHLVYSEQERQYLKSLELTKTKLYLINGGNTFLDRWTERYWQGEGIEYSFAESPFSSENPSMYYNVIGDYVITGRLDEATTREIEGLYAKNLSLEDMDFSELFRVFGAKVKASLWVEYKPEKARAIRKRFEAYFGITFGN